MEQIEALLADDPADPFLRYGLAMEHASQGDDATAVQHLRDLIALDPNKPYIPAFLMAAQSLVRLEKESEAAELLKQGMAAATRVGTPEAMHARGEMEGLLATVE
jgi:predicted Zn-dependent protease